MAIDVTTIKGCKISIGEDLAKLGVEPEDIEAVLNNYDDILLDSGGIKGPSARAQLKKRMRAVSKEAIATQQIKKIKNEKVFVELSGKIDEHLEKIKEQNEKIRENLGEDEEYVSVGSVSIQKYLEDVFFSSQEVKKGGKISVSATKAAIRRRYNSKNDMLLGRHQEILQDKNQIPGVIKAIEDIKKGDKPAAVYKEVAEDVIEFQSFIIRDLKKWGVHINSRDDFLMRQTHSVPRMSAISKGDGGQKWVDAMYDKFLDRQKTFGEGMTEKAMKKSLFESYKHIMDGTASSIKGTRSLHFKGAEELGNYHLEWSEGSYADILEQTSVGAAKAASLYHHLGSKPKEMVDKLLKHAAEGLRDAGDRSGAIDLENKKGFGGGNNIQFAVDEMIGRDDVAAPNFIATFLRASQTVQAMTKLVNAVFSTATDMTVGMAGFVSKTGNGFIQTQAETLGFYFKNFGQEQKAYFSDVFGMVSFMDDGGRFISEQIGVRGKLSKLGDLAIKWTGLDFTTKQNRQAMLMLFSANLGRNAEKAFDKLPPRLQGNLLDYGIEAKDWEILRGHIFQNKSVKLMTPKQLVNSSNIDEYKLGHKLESYLNDNARFGAIAPTERAKSESHPFNFDPNSVEGAAWDTALQFKGFTFELGMRMNEIIKSNPAADNSSLRKALSEGSNKQLLGFMGVHGTVMAMGAMMVKDVANGRDPQDVTSLENWGKAIERGLLPLSAGFAFNIARGDYTSYGRSIWGDLLGPTAGDISDITGMNSLSKAARFADKHTPFRNLPIISPLINAAFMDSWNEALDPGYMKRKRKREAKSGSHSFIPSAGI